MAKLHPQITVMAEAEAKVARAEVRSVQTPQLAAVTPLHEAREPNLFGQHEESKPKDYFVEKDGLRYAGSHLIIDMFGAENLDDEALMEKALEEAVNAAGATLLHIHVHKFSGEGGVSGVAVLAESHISVHTWPERGYAAFDIFMCGDAVPAKGIPVLKSFFNPDNTQVAEHKRGIF